MDRNSEKDPLAAPAWLPDFCSLPVLFVVMVVAELVVLIVALSPSGAGAATSGFWPHLGSASLFVQWLGLICTVSLCKLRPWLLRMRPWVGELVCYAFMVAVTAAGSALVFSVDQALSLDLTLPAEYEWRFIARNTLICALIAAALLRYFYIQEQWRERVRAEARARFEALQARIRPHFLFNSMNTIASLIRVRPADAETAVEDLSDLFRASLGKGEALRSLGEELDLAHGYLRIEQLRLGDRLRVQWDVDALPRDAELPPLLLQPLVENAVYHGIQPLSAGGTVSVIGRRDGDALSIAISNPCPPPGERRGAGNGTALANIRARIAYHFGGRGQLAVSDDGEHFHCTVRLPWAAAGTLR